jgi:4-hydroxy-4-methyl-2-oxoglutarate aldolase
MSAVSRNVLSSKCVAELARFDTATICNAIEMFEVRPRTEGYMGERIRSLCPMLGVMVGFASTATVRASRASGGRDVYQTLEQQLSLLAELSGPAVVVTQDLDDPSVAATVGEVICSMLRSAGAAGMVTSGAVRDAAQVRELGFPLFAPATICSHGYAHTVALNQAVEVGGVVVHPGDLLHGDANGVTTVPLEIADELPHVCQEYVAAEKIVLDCCQETKKASTKDLIESRKAMGEALAALKMRVSRRQEL